MRGCIAVLLCASCGRVAFDSAPDAFVPQDVVALDGIVFGTDRNYATFSPCPPELAFVAVAHCTGNTLELTSDTSSLSGAVWLAVPYSTATDISLELTLAFTNTDLNPGDGAAIVMQNDPRGTAALGLEGAGLAYETITPSVALELDTYPNAGELAAEHLGLDIDGAVDPGGPAEYPPFLLEDGTPFTVWLDYSVATQTLAASIARSPPKPTTPLVTTTTDLTHLGPQMWLGITAATGASHESHQVLAWRIDVTP